MNQQHQIRLGLAQRQGLGMRSQRRFGAIDIDPHASSVNGPTQPVCLAAANLHDQSAAVVGRIQTQSVRLGAQTPP
jgi:hypothetical protein